MWNVISGILAGVATAAVSVAGLSWLGTKVIEKAFESFTINMQHNLNLDKTKYDLVFKSSLDFKAQQLTEFYWPIYSRLQKDNAIWERILDKRKSDPILQKIAVEIEIKEVLPNHEENVKIIQSRIHLAQASPELQKLLMDYVRHVAVYKAMRAAGDYDRFPIALGEEWPHKLFGIIESQTKKLQGEYETLLEASFNKRP